MQESNPERLGWMQGFPPSKDKVIRFNDGTFYQWPQLRWTFSNIQQLVPTKFVWRGDKAATALPKHDLNFEQLTIIIENGEQLTWEQALESGQTDGLAILHKGVLVHESYHAGCKPHLPHTVMSCGKSIAGKMPHYVKP